MEKSNEIEYPIIDLIANRKSIRTFKDRSLEDGILKRLFEAARWSFSSSNQQAWRYIYGRKGEPGWQQLFDCLDEGNQAWCINAPVLIASLAAKLTSKGAPYKHNFHDVGASSMLMAIQAVAMGLQIHPMAGFFPEKVIQTFHVPDDLEPVTMIALGYPGGDDSMLKDYQKKNETERSQRFLQSAFTREGGY